MSKATLHKFMNSAGTVRASAVVCTDLLNHLRTVQQTSPTSTLALGRTLLGTTLLAAQLKDEQAVSVQMHCDGAMRMVFAQASYEGSVRAYIAEPQLPMSVERGNLILAPHVGQGTLTVSTFMKGAARPQVSQVLIESGEITEDLANYIRISQQIPCMLSTGVILGSEGVVTAAGGLLVEMMPGHTVEDVERVESSLRAMGALSQILAPGINGEQLLRLFFVGQEGNHWKHPYVVQISCSCSVEKVLGSFKLLGEEELKKIILDQEVIDVQCEMCGKKYRIDHFQVKDVYQDIKKFH
jgi:molecular chaperone Hsp33